MTTATFEKRHSQDLTVASYFLGKRRYYDSKEDVTVVKIFSGDWYMSTQGNEMLATILGSCVSVCIRDTGLGIGGMNHFLLPGDENQAYNTGEAARYGVYAMENLINALLGVGGRKERFEIKVFGGGNVTNNSARIGTRNAQFIREFMRREGYAVASEDLEGEYPRRVHYYPDSGKVMMRLLRRKEDLTVVDEEARYTKRIKNNPLEGDIELF